MFRPFSRTKFVVKTLLAILTLTLLPALLVQGADQPAKATGTKFFVQLVRGSDVTTPPEPGATLVGPKVAKQLQPMFRWKNYWEVQRATVEVEKQKVGRVELKGGHSLEIDLTQANKRAIRMFRDKKLVRTLVCAKGDEFTIQGSDPGDGKVWFIVVRSDTPST